MIYLDSETCGLHGIMVLLQYAKDDEEIKLWNVWKEPIGETLALVEWVASQEVCGFNLAFDWFHVAKLYTTFSLLLESEGPDAIPEEHIDELGEYEEKARFLDFCIKPKAACDIMLHARKGSYQSLMSRHSIRVKRIPILLAEAVRSKLETSVELDGIHFAKRKDPTAPRWVIKDIIDKSTGDMDTQFKDVVLTFHPSGALKDLARYALNVKEDLILKFTDIEPDPVWKPVELGYAPFAGAIGSPGKWKGAWPEVIRHYISHWAYNPLAKKYGADDVIYTRDLHKYFGSPEAGDDDSELACMVGAARWRGFVVDTKKFAKRRVELIKKSAGVPTSPRVAKIYLEEVMDEMEKVALNEGTAAVILESIAGKEDKEGNWDHSQGWLVDDKPHPAAVRAREILEARRADKERENCDKLLLAGRFHASFKVIGALSSRMSGADKLNPQGIKAKKDVRLCFPLADFSNGFVLCGGDFVSFEIILAEAVYKDKKLRADLRAGKSIHGLFAEELFNVSYDDIMASKGTSAMYTDGKRGIFSQLYGGNEHTIESRLGVDIETATKASEGFMKRYPGIRKARKNIHDRFCSMRQPGGIGTAVEWHTPDNHMESLLGFQRDFTLENTICKILFDLAQEPPPGWKDVRVKVKRRDRLQTAAGAVMSALYAAAFNIQSSNMRQAANHQIQSTGAQITKRVQRKIWDIQPIGVNPWIAQTLNVHDEIHVVTRPEHVDNIANIVNNTVETFRNQIPLIKIDWNKEEHSWADK